MTCLSVLWGASVLFRFIFRYGVLGAAFFSVSVSFLRARVRPPDVERFRLILCLVTGWGGGWWGCGEDDGRTLQPTRQSLLRWRM